MKKMYLGMSTRTPTCTKIPSYKYRLQFKRLCLFLNWSILQWFGLRIDWFPMMFEFGWSLHVIGKNVSTSVYFFCKNIFTWFFCLMIQSSLTRKLSMIYSFIFWSCAHSSLVIVTRKVQVVYNRLKMEKKPII